MMRVGLLSVLIACQAEEQPAVSPPVWQEDPARMLPTPWLDRPCMDVALADLDADTDLDLVIATEGPANVVLLNDGSGRFTHHDIPFRSPTDSEHALVADLNGDGHLDLFFANEDLGGANELYLGSGGLEFVDASDSVDESVPSNAVVAADFDGDGWVDVMIGNAGPNSLWRGGSNGLVAAHNDVPPTVAVTQDLAVGDVDGDGDLDVAVGNEGLDAIWLNDGAGRFTEQIKAIAGPSGETREIALGDVDGDGVLDLVASRVGFSGDNPQSFLWLGRGDGTFRRDRNALPQESFDTLDLDLVDLDGDGDLDLLGAHTQHGPGGLLPGPWTAWENDEGTFGDVTAAWFVDLPHGNGLDIEAGDLDQDGGIDVVLCSRGGPDRVLFHTLP
ncbi:MAG: VCBS repeat-containing protein [Myxococcota bacterium]